MRRTLEGTVSVEQLTRMIVVCPTLNRMVPGTGDAVIGPKITGAGKLHDLLRREIAAKFSSLLPVGEGVWEMEVPGAIALVGSGVGICLPHYDHNFFVRRPFKGPACWFLKRVHELTVEKVCVRFVSKVLYLKRYAGKLPKNAPINEGALNHATFVIVDINPLVNAGDRELIDPLRLTDQTHGDKTHRIPNDLIALCRDKLVIVTDA